MLIRSNYLNWSKHTSGQACLFFRGQKRLLLSSQVDIAALIVCSVNTAVAISNADLLAGIAGKPCNKTASIQNLYVVPVDERHCFLDCFLIINAFDELRRTCILVSSFKKGNLVQGHDWHSKSPQHGKLITMGKALTRTEVPKSKGRTLVQVNQI